ncbi:TIM44-like domain-containing protein [Candidatus Saccharibacteria bacterium]|nr:TIM44-like domain-containing protein [Candidatus Saccharibacteria bacterium]
MLHSALLLDYFARGGGGGSGGGGGGGGGGSGGGVIILVGYLPMHFIGNRIRRFALKPGNTVMDIGLHILGWICAVVYCVILMTFFDGWGILMGIAALVGMAAGLYDWFNKTVKQGRHVKNLLKTAASRDAAWDETQLTEHAKSIFTRYQQDWASFNTEAMRNYMTPRYQHHAALLLYALQLLERRNDMKNIHIESAVIVAADDQLDNTKDAFTVGITARAFDQLIDVRSQQSLYTDQSTFTEYWRFVRSRHSWLLDGIQQGTESGWTRNPLLEAFAGSHGYYFSADMGWLLIPAKGQFFGSAKFGTSDINNHVIGVHNETLAQIYTYCPTTESTKSYLIAQMNVPRKNYGQIIVRRKQGFHPFGVRGLERIETEWLDFNKKYEVFAASHEQATSFELLNPRYMEQLEAAPFEVNIEVVDNVVYFYSDERKTDATNYEAMLKLLQAAWQEMRL